MCDMTFKGERGKRANARYKSIYIQHTEETGRERGGGEDSAELIVLALAIENAVLLMRMRI